MRDAVAHLGVFIDGSVDPAPWIQSSTPNGAATLRNLGFGRATDLAGGFNGWVAAGMPVEQLGRR